MRVLPIINTNFNNKKSNPSFGLSLPNKKTAVSTVGVPSEFLGKSVHSFNNNNTYKENFIQFCTSISRLPKNSRTEIAKKTFSELNMERVDAEQAKAVFNKLGERTFANLFRAKDESGKTLMHHVFSDSSMDINRESDFINLLKKKSPELLDEIILAKDENGDIPIKDNVQMYRTLKMYADNIDMIKKILSSKNNNGDNALHRFHAGRLSSEIFEHLKDEPEFLVEILSSKNNQDKTPLQMCTNSYDSGVIYNKIMELSANEALPLEKTLGLLEANGLVPEIKERRIKIYPAFFKS